VLAAAASWCTRAAGPTDIEQHRKAASLIPDWNGESNIASTLPIVSIKALVDYVQDSKIITSKSEIVEKPDEIERDLQHYKLHRSFRRVEWLPKVTH
jgi:hypothetical protein